MQAKNSKCGKAKPRSDIPLSFLIKFMFSKKAAIIDKIFTIDLTLPKLTSNLR